MEQHQLSWIANFIWGIADDVLRDTSSAWREPASGKTGHEISFTRYFSKPQPQRTLAEICADILALERKTEGLLDEILGGND